MEITIKDLQYFKLSPSLIILLKCIHGKNDELLIELNKVSDVFIMAKHLEGLNLIKIVGDKLSYISFEISQIKTINYIENKNENNKFKKEIDNIIIFFKEITGEARVEQALKSKAFRSTISGRLKEGYSVDDIKGVIKMMNDKWKNDPIMKDYIRIETICNATKFQGYVGKLGSIENVKDFSDDI